MWRVEVLTDYLDDCRMCHELVRQVAEQNWRVSTDWLSMLSASVSTVCSSPYRLLPKTDSNFTLCGMHLFVCACVCACVSWVHYEFTQSTIIRTATKCWFGAVFWMHFHLQWSLPLSSFSRLLFWLGGDRRKLHGCEGGFNLPIAPCFYAHIGSTCMHLLLFTDLIFHVHLKHLYNRNVVVIHLYYP